MFVCCLSCVRSRHEHVRWIRLGMVDHRASGDEHQLLRILRNALCRSVKRETPTAGEQRESLVQPSHCSLLFSCCVLPELTALAQSHSNVTNLHVSAHVDKHSISMQYTVLPGVSTRSFGVHVASVAHFPKIVVDMAREKAMELEAFGGGEQSSMAATAASSKRSDDSALSSGGHLGIPLVDASEVAEPQPEWMCELLNHAPDFVDAVGEQDAEALGEWIQKELAKRFPSMPRPESNGRKVATGMEERKEMEF